MSRYFVSDIVISLDPLLLFVYIVYNICLYYNIFYIISFSVSISQYEDSRRRFQRKLKKSGICVRVCSGMDDSAQNKNTYVLREENDRI